MCCPSEHENGFSNLVGGPHVPSDLGTSRKIDSSYLILCHFLCCITEKNKSLAFPPNDLRGTLLGKKLRKNPTFEYFNFLGIGDKGTPVVGLGSPSAMNVAQDDP